MHLSNAAIVCSTTVRHGNGVHTTITYDGIWLLDCMILNGEGTGKLKLREDQDEKDKEDKKEKIR